MSRCIVVREDSGPIGSALAQLQEGGNIPLALPAQKPPPRRVPRLVCLPLGPLAGDCGDSGGAGCYMIVT